VEAQAGHLAEVEQSFAPLPVHTVPYLDAEPVGPAALARVAEAMYGASDPFAPPTADPPLRITPEGELILALPFAEKGEVDLARKGDELIVNAGSYRRVLALPAALARRSVREAVLRDGFLRVRFQSGGPDD
jgi:arsenite-transporting ATPase